MKVRTALESNVEALITLNIVVQNLHAELYPKYFKPADDISTIETFFKKTLANPTSMIAIVEAGDAIIGYVWLETQERPETPLKKSLQRLYVHHIAVSPTARRKGAASELMRFVEEKAISEGISEIMLDTWAANKEALAFFAARGFLPIRIVQQKII